MSLRHLWLAAALVSNLVAASPVAAAGIVTLADAGAQLLRGATFYRIAPGVAVQDGDILAVGAKAQVQVELTGGSVLALAGPGSLWLAMPKNGPVTLTMPTGVLKAVAKASALRIRTAAFDVIPTDAILVLQAELAAGALFLETGAARLVNPTSPPRDAKRGEYWQKSLAGAFVTRLSPPRSFVDALPGNFLDALPALAAGIKSRPLGAGDHDITYAEAQPWLALDRPAFERRFSVRLRDPAFRKAADAEIGRYPLWDRMLHPEKYAPKPTPPK